MFPPNLGNVIGIAAGPYHVLALQADRTVVGWGLPDADVLAIPPAISDVVAVRAGQRSSGALKADGTVVHWGAAQQLAPPAGAGVFKDVQFGFNDAVGLRTDGTVVQWAGTTIISPLQGLSGVTAISSGGSHILALTQRPLITGIQGPEQAILGATVTFSVSVIGSEVQFAWEQNGFPISHGTNATLTIHNFQLRDTGTYRVKVSNQFGSVISSTAEIRLQSALTVSALQDLRLYRGETGSFQVLAEGVPPLSYQWFKDDVLIPGATEAALTLAPPMLVRTWSV